MSPIPVILDCDPGHDDAIMMLLALTHPQIDVKGITVCAANQTQDKTFENAGRLLTLFNRTEIPLARGAEYPMIRPLRTAGNVHGESGIDGAELPPNRAANISSLDSSSFIHELVNNSKEKITLVATGALTNIANYLRKYPDDITKIEKISLMGGACFGGNITPTAEFNIYVDPEAADIVFRAGVPIIMSGLDVTLKAQMMKQDIELMKQTSSIGMVIAGLIEFYHKTTTPNFLTPEKEEGAHMHDPCAIAYLINPDLFLAKEMNVTIDTRDGPTLGQTICDYNKCTERKPNATVLFDIKRSEFIHLLISAVHHFKK